MRKKSVRILIPLFISFALLTGCAGAPEATDDDEILRAKGASEEAIEDIVNREEGAGAAEEGTEGIKEADGMSLGKQSVNVVLGSGESRMKIEAEIQAAPEMLPAIMMQADDVMTEETMRQFLDPQGEVTDITEKLLAEWEAEKQRIAEIDEKLGEGSSIVEMATIGDDSYRAITDGNRKAIFNGNVGGSYEDAALMEKCREAAREMEGAEKMDIKDGDTGDDAFSLQEAKEVLLKKLSVLGIEDICVFEAYFYEKDGLAVYEMRYVPVVDGMPVAYCFGQHTAEDVHPDGYAWVCAEGIAEVELRDFCMKQAQAGEENRILGWDKVQELLEMYLDNGSLQCGRNAADNVAFSTADLVWYPELKGKELELAPMWNISMDLGEYVDYCGESGVDDSAWNIYINAVTGELEAVQ